jgi:hypothetical protein
VEDMNIFDDNAFMDKVEININMLGGEVDGADVVVVMKA